MKKADEVEEEAPPKRNFNACDQCSSRNMKCSPIAGSVPAACVACLRSNPPKHCTFARPKKKRGRPTKYEPLSTTDAVPPPTLQPSELAESAVAVTSGSPDLPVELLVTLCDVYHEHCYPIFPYFHWPSLQAALLVPATERSQPLEACLMALGAVASARVRDGGRTLVVAGGLASWSPEAFAAASEAAFPSRLTDCAHFGYFRASVLLAIAAIHSAQSRRFQEKMGQAITIMSINRLEDERFWPADMTYVEREELRRVIWSFYTLEVYSATTFGNMLRLREAQCQVAYPSECDDEALSSAAPAADLTGKSWLFGWNQTTTLYRILEHTLYGKPNRASGQAMPPPLPAAIGISIDTTTSILKVLAQLRSELPAPFLTTRPWTGDRAIDRFSFQSANLLATQMTCRVAALSVDTSELEANLPPLEEAMRELADLPVQYLQSISAPFCHHVAGIGYVLANSIDLSGSNKAAVLRTKAVLCGPSAVGSLANSLRETLAQLLRKLEAGLSFSHGTAAGVEAHIALIDASLANMDDNAATLPSTGLVEDLFDFKLWPEDIVTPAYVDALRSYE